MIKKLSLVIAIGLLGLLMFTSCTAPASAPQERMRGVIEAQPNVVAPSESFAFVGANFLPNEKLQVSYYYPPLDEGLEPISVGFMVTTDEIGSFFFDYKIQARKEFDNAICPVIVYDGNGKEIASTLFVVKKPPEKK